MKMRRRPYARALHVRLSRSRERSAFILGRDGLPLRQGFGGHIRAFPFFLFQSIAAAAPLKSVGGGNPFCCAAS